MTLNHTPTMTRLSRLLSFLRSQITMLGYRGSFVKARDNWICNPSTRKIKVLRQKWALIPFSAGKDISSVDKGIPLLSFVKAKVEHHCWAKGPGCFQGVFLPLAQ